MNTTFQDLSNGPNSNERKMNDPHNDQHQELVLVVHKVFNNPDGKRLLQILDENFLNKPVVYNDSMAAAGIREGQNDMIRRVKAILKQQV